MLPTAAQVKSQRYVHRMLLIIGGVAASAIETPTVWEDDRCNPRASL